jgi:hypothetical protein
VPDHHNDDQKGDNTERAFGGKAPTRTVLLKANFALRDESA